jgi:hypothetical protein
MFNNEYGEYIIVFYERNNNSFHNKLKKLIKKDAFNYFNLNINDENTKELIFEFIFSNLISSYVYWNNHKNIISLESYVEFANNIISNGVNTILNNK